MEVGDIGSLGESKWIVGKINGPLEEKMVDMMACD